MKVNDMVNLFVAEHETMDFRVLVLAEDAVQAKTVVVQYLRDAKITGGVNVREFTDVNLRIDCDRVITPFDTFAI